MLNTGCIVFNEKHLNFFWVNKPSFVKLLQFVKLNIGVYTALCCILFKWFVNKRVLFAQDICSSKSIATIVVKIFVVSTTYCTYFCVLSGFCLFFWKKGELACKLQIPLFNRHWEGSHICPLSMGYTVQPFYTCWYSKSKDNVLVGEILSSN